MAARDVVILGAARTPIGSYGGSFKDVHPAELGRLPLARRSSGRASPLDEIDEVLIGHGRQAGSGPNPARQVGRSAPAFLRTRPRRRSTRPARRACRRSPRRRRASCSASRTVVLAGGIESMSRMPYLIDSADARWGHRMGNFTLVDAMYRDGFQDPLSGLIMGETAEILARQYGITREASDRSRSRASRRRRRRRRPATSRARSRRCTVTGEGQVRRRRQRRTSAARHRRSRRLRKLPLVFPKVEGHAGIITAGRRPASPTAAPRSCSRPTMGRDRGLNAAGAASSAGRAPAWTRASWASVRCRRSQAARAHRPRHVATSTSSR